VVFAATSLTDAFNKIADQFQAANPGVTVKFNYNGSSSLASRSRRARRPTSSPRRARSLVVMVFRRDSSGAQ
jgi:ABC-type glycerol-3-phosphate transport system substrate-binding protein